MYIPQHFKETRIEVLHELIRRRPFGALVVSTPDGLEASHVPFVLAVDPPPNGRLLCHVARANPIWRYLDGRSEALAIFQGEDAYISPSWYEAKRRSGKVVPTWDYAVVHAYGAPRLIEDPERLRALVSELTDRHEAGRDEPWKVSDAPAEYIDQLLREIVGIEIPIARIAGSFKLSQNRSVVDRQRVAAGLSASGAAHDAAIAKMILQTVRPDSDG
jgi:transcriptional regulator